MYKTMLVPLDGSKRAEAILPYVEDLAQRYKAGVLLLRIVEPPVMFIGPEQLHTGGYYQEYETRTEQAGAYLNGVQGVFQKKGIETRTRLAHGPVAETIIRIAEEERADLVALASHGRSGLARVFYGSVAAGVLQRIDRPLLLVRSQGDS